MTNKQITFDALNGYFLNTETGAINTDYLNECIYCVFDIEYRHTNAGNGKSKLYALLTNNRRKPSAIVWEAFLNFANRAIENEFYPRQFTATSDQLKAWLKAYNLDYSVFNPVLAEVERMRAEAQEGSQ